MLWLGIPTWTSYTYLASERLKMSGANTTHREQQQAFSSLHQPDGVVNVSLWWNQRLSITPLGNQRLPKIYWLVPLNSYTPMVPLCPFMLRFCGLIVNRCTFSVPDNTLVSGGRWQIRTGWGAILHCLDRLKIASQFVSSEVILPSMSSCICFQLLCKRWLLHITVHHDLMCPSATSTILPLVKFCT